LGLFVIGAAFLVAVRTAARVANAVSRISNKAK